MRQQVLLGLLVLGFAGGGANAADERFSQSLRPDDFAAAGLAKLTPEELARLDALVRSHPARVSEPASVVAREPRSSAKPAKQRVTVAPGTQIDYETVESRIAGDFRGWERRTVFTLENGQRWRVTSDHSYDTAPIKNPTVKIEPGMLGSFWMSIEGVRQRVKVAPLTSN